MRGWREGPNLSCCWKCPCDQQSLYQDVHNAPWRNRAYTQAAWVLMMMTSAIRKFPLLAVPGFIIAYVTADLMHAGDLGVLPIVLGNVLWNMFQKMGGTLKRPTQALANIMNMLKLACKEVPISDLTINMIKMVGKGPLLKTKAAESRHMLKAIAYLLQHPGLRQKKKIPRPQTSSKQTMLPIFICNAYICNLL